MSRFGYDDYDELPEHWYRQDVERAFKSGPGRRRLQELLSALDAMPRHELSEDWSRIVGWTDDGETPILNVCALGALAAYRHHPTTPDEWNEAANAAPFGDGDDPWDIAEWAKPNLGWPARMANHLQYVNDEWIGGSDADRWATMRAWVAGQIDDPDPWRVPVPVKAVGVGS